MHDRKWHMHIRHCHVASCKNSTYKLQNRTTEKRTWFLYFKALHNTINIGENLSNQHIVFWPVGMLEAFGGSEISKYDNVLK